MTVKSASTVSLKMQNADSGVSVNRSKVLLSTAYLAPVEYYEILLNAGAVCLEQCEYYQKQSYRNRCRILTANGVMDLTIPVVNKGKQIIKDIEISEHDDWQLKHWRAIESAYSSSPFFEYYMDDILPFYLKKWKYLWDFNLEINHKIFEILELEFQFKLTSFYENSSVVFADYRNKIHPKADTNLNFKSYYQVFGQKFGFQSNLSIIDLLFNMGPESELILRY